MSSIKFCAQEIEKKWQKNWIKSGIFVTNLQDKEKDKKYVLAMFPYPSGAGLHIGHIRNYTIADAVARYYRLCGFNVFFPIGWDSFGLPAEQYAIQTGNHPATFTQENIVNFKKQLLSMGFSYDWSREIDTSDPNYYHWTQWIFCQMYEKGLVDFQKRPVFWCPKLGTVLANEEIIKIDQQKVSERGNYPVVKKNILQWVLKITRYARRLLEGLKELNWPKNIKTLQVNWIGLQEGIIIDFLVDGINCTIPVFIQRVDAILAISALGLSVTHGALKFIVCDEYMNRVKEFCCLWEKDDNCNEQQKEILGQFVGSYAIHPLNEEKIPIFVVNFVNSDSQTIFFRDSNLKNKSIFCEDYREAIPITSFFSFKEEWGYEICDEDFFSKEEKQRNRNVDFIFQNRFIAEKKSVFKVKNGNVCSYENTFFEDKGKKKDETVKLVIELLKKNLGANGFSLVERYRLRDWIFCRQRYWGEPIPIIHFSGRKELLNCQTDLPLVLPYLQDFVPDGIHYAPLQKLKSWVTVRKDDNLEEGTRDVNVMPQWAGSCWYYLGFLLKKTNDGGYFKLSDFSDLLNHWLPVDVYIGGSEHANLHLLYSRFWHKFLYDIGLVKKEEPFKQLVCQGIILGADGEKMSKSRGNIINPDPLVMNYGADALRLYVVFLGPIDKTVNFDSQGVRSMKKWLDRVYNLFWMVKSFRSGTGDFSCKEHNSLLFSYKRMVGKVTEFYQKRKLNLVISSLMAFINDCYLSAVNEISVDFLLTFCQLLSPIAPHISEELWHFWKDSYVSSSLLEKSIFFCNSFTKSSDNNLVIQVNGKKRAIVKFIRDINFNDLGQVLREYPQLKKILGKSKIVKIISVRDKLVNFVVE